MDLPCLSAQQKRVCFGHRLEEMNSNVIMPIWVRPTTVDKAAFGIFVRTTWGLNYTVQGNEFGNNQFSHVLSPMTSDLQVRSRPIFHTGNFRARQSKCAFGKPTLS